MLKDAMIQMRSRGTRLRISLTMKTTVGSAITENLFDDGELIDAVVVRD
jgi:hypothetical protein